MNISNLKIPSADFKGTINSDILNKLQELPLKQHYKSKPILGELHHGLRLSWKLSYHESEYNYIICSFLLKNEHPPECTVYQEAYTVKYILTNCSDLALRIS